MNTRTEKKKKRGPDRDYRRRESLKRGRAVKTEYSPEITVKAIRENHGHFRMRQKLYRNTGFDHIKNRDSILKRARPLYGEILEIGTGRGYMSLVLARKGFRIITVDSDADALRTAALNLAHEKKARYARFFRMDAGSLSFPDQSFDHIVSVYFFHHVKNRDSVFREMDRVLKPAGRLIVADFNRKGIRLIEAVHREENKIHENTGIGKEEIRSFLSGLDYRIQEYDEEYHWTLICEKKDPGRELPL